MPTKKKPTLKVTKETIYSVDYDDLEFFVQEVYGANDYSFVAVEECGNDSSHEFDVDPNDISEFDFDDVENIRKGDIDTYRNGLLLNVLCLDGYIEPGSYTIRVCW